MPLIRKPNEGRTIAVVAARADDGRLPFYLVS